MEVPLNTEAERQFVPTATTTATQELGLAGEHVYNNRALDLGYFNKVHPLIRSVTI